MPDRRDGDATAAPTSAAAPVEVKLSRMQLEYVAREVCNSVVARLVRALREPSALALTVAHAAHALDCSANVLREAIDSGVLAAYSMGGNGDLRILVSDLEKWLCAAPAMDPRQVERRKARRHGRCKASGSGEVAS